MPPCDPQPPNTLPSILLYILPNPPHHLSLEQQRDPGWGCLPLRGSQTPTVPNDSQLGVVRTGGREPRNPLGLYLSPRNLNLQGRRGEVPPTIGSWALSPSSQCDPPPPAKVGTPPKSDSRHQARVRRPIGRTFHGTPVLSRALAAPPNSIREGAFVSWKVGEGPTQLMCSPTCFPVGKAVPEISACPDPPRPPRCTPVQVSCVNLARSTIV